MSSKRYASHAGGSASEYGHKYRMFGISNDTFKTVGKMTNWVNNCDWFEEKWMYDQVGDASNQGRKRKGKKKTSVVLKATIEGKCKQKLKVCKKFMHTFVDAVEHASNDELSVWLQANCRGLRITVKQLKAWEQEGYALDGIFDLIGARSMGLKDRLKLNHGQWQCLLSMHDQILRGDISYDVSDNEKGLCFGHILFSLCHKKK